jgi:phage-related protein
VAHLASAAATRTVAAAQWAWNAAMSANPIGLVIAAVVALVAGFILLYKRSERFRAIVQAVMAASRKAIDAVWKVLQRVGHFIGVVLVTYWRVYSTAAKVAWNVVRTVVTTVIGKVVSIVQGARARLVAVWDAVKAAAVRVWNALRDTVVSVVTRIVEKAADVREKFGNAFQGILDKGREVFAALLAPIQKVIDLVEKVVDAISNIKLPDIDLPNIPGLRAIAVPVAGRAAPAGGGDTVNIHLPLLAALDQRMIALLITALENYYRRRGQRVQLVAS